MVSDTSSKFISDFHKLEGITIKERKRNLQNLLKNISKDEEHFILENLNPTTYLETLFQIDILIHLRKTSALFEILKGANEIFVSKIMKQLWILQEVFKDVGTDELVNDIFPSFSFSVKMKVLKKIVLIWTPEKVDQVFDAVLTRYGLFMATTVIQGCTTTKIVDILQKHEVKLWTNQLKAIYDKEPKLITVYLDECSKRNNLTCENSFLIYLAQKNPAFFWEIIEKYDIKNNLMIGRRTTKKFVNVKKKEIITEPKKYVKYLRYETLVRKLNTQGDFKKLYENLFPKYIEDLTATDELSAKLLRYCPMRGQYDLLSATFSKVLKVDFWSNVHYLKNYDLKFVTDKSIREKWAQLRYVESNDVNYMKYYKTENCLPLIKEKINFTSSIDNRLRLLCILVECCAMNKDLTLLELVLKYFCEKHQNDNQYVRKAFIQTFERNVKYEELSEKHWKYLKEIIVMQHLNEGHWCYVSDFEIRYLEYLCKSTQNEDFIKKATSEYLKYNIFEFNWRESLREFKNAEIEKKILLNIFDCFPIVMEALNKNSEDMKSPMSEIILEIYQFNMRHPKHKININENESLRNSVKESIKYDYSSYHYCREWAFLQTLCKLNRSDFEEEILNLYWENLLPHTPNNIVLIWYLKHDPKVILNNFDKIFNKTLKINSTGQKKIWYMIKKYSHLKLDDLLKTHCLNKLNNDENNSSSWIRPLSILSGTEDFMQIMEDGGYMPTSAILDVEYEKMRNEYKLRIEFVKNLVNVKEPLKILPILVEKFCAGIYLQSSLIALYNSFHKSPENELKIYLENLKKRDAISVKKHALFFVCSVFNQELATQTLKEIGKQEQNSSLQKFLISSSLKYFSKNPSDELFTLVTSYMNFLNKHDVESLTTLWSINIPKCYKARYIQSAWKLLESFKADGDENNVGVANVKSAILDLIDEECINEISFDFCKNIIQNYFLKEDSQYENIPCTVSFVVKFLLCFKESTENSNLVFDLLTSFKEKNWFTFQVNERQKIYNFFKVFCKEVYNSNRQYDVTRFATSWQNVFTPLETFEEWVALNLLKYVRKTEIHAEKIAQYAEDIYAEFDHIVFPKFVIGVAKFFDIIDLTDEERIDLLYDILKCKTTRVSYILVIELIRFRGDIFYENNIRMRYKEIITILSQVTDPTVKLYYNLLLKGYIIFCRYVHI